MTGWARRSVTATLIAACALAPPWRAAAATQAPIFVDDAAASGLTFHYFSGMSGKLYFVEMMGPGVALFDYDGDGDLDAFFPQGHMLGEGRTLDDATLPPGDDKPLTGRLYRNDLQVRADGTRSLHFTDVTSQSGIRANGYGMGAAVGDYDNDGDPDLYVLNFDGNQLWRNNGDGTFTDVTRQARVGDDRWSSSATFFDYDGDGFLDLYVAEYVDYGLRNDKACFTSAGARDYCGPLSYDPVPDRLFHNRGDGTFEDVSAVSGIAAKPGNGLGVVATDLDGDGDPDLYVANDQMVNFLWVNQGRGKFTDEAVLSGTAVNGAGMAEASMGVAVGDIDNDGDFDLLLTHLNRETNTLYINQSSDLFVDSTLPSGLGPASLPYTSFGTAWLDYDNDGWLDLFAANGDVKVIEAQRQAGDVFPLHQINQLFHNDHGHFTEVTAQAGTVFALSEVSRGAAFGDIDNDGDPDVLVANNSGPARLLINQRGQDQAWIGIRLLDPRLERDAYGAIASIQLPDGRTLSRQVHTDGSYSSASDPRLIFGLGQDRQAVTVTVRWPDGYGEVFGPLKPGAYHRLERGTGRATHASPASQ
jgi:hypothetical protein